MSQIPNRYVFRNPFSSSIRPILNPDETLSLLNEINASRAPEKRLPIEILLQVHEEIHASGNTLIQKIQDSWTLLTWNGTTALHSRDNWRLPMLNLREKKYYLSKKLDPTDNDIWMRSCYMRHPSLDGRSVDQLSCHISSADLLYRLRCCFPEITISSNNTYSHYFYIWVVSIKHNQSGMLLKFADFKAAAKVTVFYNIDSIYGRANELTKQMLIDAFAVDTQSLLSVLHETTGGSRRLAYYHPAAIADFVADDEHDQERGYIAVPYEIRRSRRHNESTSVYHAWRFTGLVAANLSSFYSILRDLKYDVSSRKIVRSKNGTADLTAVISSALLFYRLICKFAPPHPHDNINTIPPITSVWQVKLIHIATLNSVIFMDDCGLFDIRACPGIKEDAVRDVEALVEALCSDNCTHPYDCVVAGCIS